MNKIQDYNQITHLINKIKSYKEGYITNFYLGEPKCKILINKDLMYCVEDGKCIFILHKDFDFYHLYYLTTNKNPLSFPLRNLLKKYPDIILVSDVLGPESTIQNIINLYNLEGFQEYKKFIRLSCVNIVFDTNICEEEIEYASGEHSYQIKELIKKHFDKFSEQLPMIEEINQWVEDKNILIRKNGKEIIGFLIFEINGLTATIRYWFVNPDFRNKKIGSHLIKNFFYKCRHTKRKLLWVMEDNENAIVRYKHFGFKPESMLDQILIKTNG